MCKRRKFSPLLAFLFLIPALCLLTSGCGFRPIYGAQDAGGAPVAERLNAVAIDNIADRPGQELRNDLIDRMYGHGRPAQPLYRLTVHLRTAEANVGLLANATTTLAELDSYADYALFDMKGKKLLSGTAHSGSGFSRLNDEYATVAARESAIDRTVSELAEQITNRLSLFFANPPASP